MANIKPRIKIPKTAEIGEIVTVKTLINHIMESGRRKNPDTGEIIPRMIIHTFEAHFNGKEVVTFSLEGSVSENPLFVFTMKVPEAGELNCKWIDDEGAVYEASKPVAIA